MRVGMPFKSRKELEKLFEIKEEQTLAKFSNDPSILRRALENRNDYDYEGLWGFYIGREVHLIILAQKLPDEEHDKVEELFYKIIEERKEGWIDKLKNAHNETFWQEYIKFQKDNLNKDNATNPSSLDK